MALNSAERSLGARPRSCPQSRGVGGPGKARVASAGSGESVGCKFLVGAPPQRPLNHLSLSPCTPAVLPVTRCFFPRTLMNTYYVPDRPGRGCWLPASQPRACLSLNTAGCGLPDPPPGAARGSGWGSDARAKFDGGRCPRPGFLDAAPAPQTRLSPRPAKSMISTDMFLAHSIHSLNICRMSERRQNCQHLSSHLVKDRNALPPTPPPQDVRSKRTSSFFDVTMLFLTTVTI